MFEMTSTGYRATTEAVTFWEARDTCPCCSAVHSPTRTENGTHFYICRCDSAEPVEWTRAA